MIAGMLRNDTCLSIQGQPEIRCLCALLSLGFRPGRVAGGVLLISEGLQALKLSGNSLDSSSRVCHPWVDQRRGPRSGRTGCKERTVLGSVNTKEGLQRGCAPTCCTAEILGWIPRVPFPRGAGPARGTAFSPPLAATDSRVSSPPVEVRGGGQKVQTQRLRVLKAPGAESEPAV